MTQLDLIEWLAALPPAPGVRTYAAGMPTGNRAGTTPRIHARFDQDRAICGAAPALRASRWVPTTAEITCAKCISLVRYNEDAAARFAEHHPGL